MPSSKIDLIFEAIDRTSATVNKIDSGIKGLSGSSSALGSALSGVFAGAGIAAFNTAISAATATFDAFGDAISRGASRQSDLISSAGGLAVAINQPISNATDILRDLNAELTQSVSSLPGATQAYLDLAGGIADNLVPAAKDLAGNLNIDQLQQVTKEITEAYGVIASGQGVQTPDVVKALQGAISGRSISELRNLLLFQEGTGSKVLEEIQNQLIARNVSELKDLDERARIEVIKIAGEKFATDEFKDALANTFEGNLEGIKTIFDRLTDFSRVLSGRNNLSVIDAATDVLKSVMGLFDKISTSLGQAFGVNDETLLTFVFDSLKGLSSFIDSVAASIDTNALTAFFSRIQDVFNAINDLVSNDNLAAASDIFSGGFDIGKKIGEAIRNWVESIDWSNVLIDFGEVIIAVVNFAAGFVMGLNEELRKMWLNLLAGILDTLVSGFQGILLSVGEAINSWVSQVVSKVQEFGTNLISKINEIWNALISAVGNAIESAKSAIQNALKNIGSTIVNTVTGGGGTGGSAKLEDAGATYSRYSTGNTISNNSNPVFNITLVIGNNINPDAMADQLMNAIDQRWKQYNNTFVNAV